MPETKQNICLKRETRENKPAKVGKLIPPSMAVFGMRKHPMWQERFEKIVSRACIELIAM